MTPADAADVLTHIEQLTARLRALEPTLRHRAQDSAPDGSATRTCSIEGCEKTVDARGWCSMHYRRWRVHGSLADPPRLQLPMVDSDGCWIWQGRLSRLGYGQVWADGRNREAHIVVYELLVGPVPVGLELDHLCRKRACVRPDHLEPVTHRENTLRGDGPTARNARKTECDHGHPFDEHNTVWLSDGRRDCRACRTIRQRAKDRRRREARRAGGGGR